MKVIDVRLVKQCVHCLLVLILTACSAIVAKGSNSIVGDGKHPNLVLTAQGVAEINHNLNKFPLFTKEFNSTKASVDDAMKVKIEVPVPKDAGGGYTHEQHKRNYKTIHDAGFLYQLTGEEEYADFARDILLKYAELFPTLKRHPIDRSSSPGRLFWQSLNEAVWLVYSIQGYDAIIDSLDDNERHKIEENLFVPLATFLSDGQPKTFDRIHNHGTWANAAVGMTGYVLGRDDFVKKALYGLDLSGNSGFFKQMEELFSPDGYYNEGPYYHRYALLPFVVFAQAIENNDPQLGVFKFRNKILIKAIYGIIQLSYNKLFFPLNDAIKDKGIDTTELLYGVSIAYGITGDTSLLSIAKQQGSVVLTGDGLALARGLEEHLEQAFPYKSMMFRDGSKGKRGALAILRSGSEPGHQALVVKNTSQGLGHGHFDKLSWLYFDNGYEIVQDYGAARFLNIVTKNGGRYLPENKTWAKQTIAHNTLVVDETSHFDNKLKLAEKLFPKILKFDIQDKVELVTAEMSGAYDDVDFIRTMALIKDSDLEFPFVLDILKAKTNGKIKHQYDLPVHYRGHLIDVNFPLEVNTKTLKTLGESNGYQHLWLKANGRLQPENNLAQVTWIQDKRFYTFSALAADKQQFLFTELGANDPNFNLRRENAFIQRINNSGTHTFVSVLETHGEYNPVLEYTRGIYSEISDISLIEKNNTDFVLIETNQGKKWALGIAYDAEDSTLTTLSYGDKTYEWQGFYKLFEL